MTPQESFAISFRRVLHLAVLLDNACDYLNMEEETPSLVAGRVIEIKKAIEKLYKFCEKYSPNSWREIREDLTSDQLQDTALILDELTNIVNVDDLLGIIREWKKDGALKPYEPINS